MEEALFNDTKLAAYHLWEYTHLDNTLQLWYCVEDIACFLKREQYSSEDVQKIAELLVNESIDNGLGIAKDDMTVLVARVDKI